MVMVQSPIKHPAAYRAQVSHSFQGVLQEGNLWDELLGNSSSETIFLTTGWLYSWERTYGKNSRLIIVHVYRHKQLVAAAAFENEAGVLVFAGKGPSDYADIVLSKELSDSQSIYAIDLLLDGAVLATEGFRCFKLTRVQSDSRAFSILNSGCCKYFTTLTNQTMAPRMEMSVVEEKLKKKSLIRHERKLEKTGTLQDFHCKGTDEMLSLLEQLFEQHIERWQGTPSPSLFVNEVSKEFFRNVVANLGDLGWLRLSALRLDGALIAAHFGFVHAGRYTWYKPSFDVSLSKFSPGEVLLKRLLEEARNEPVDIFDFTIGDEAFKLRFATETPVVQNFYVTNSSLLHYVVRARQAVKQIARKIFSRT